MVERRCSPRCCLSAKRLIGSPRDIGYSTTEAIGDLVDDSAAAGAQHGDVTLASEGEDAYVRIVDDGAGMNGVQITEAMRYGAERRYEHDDLGKPSANSTTRCARLVRLDPRGASA